MVLLSPDSIITDRIAFNKQTYHDVAETLIEWQDDGCAYAAWIEDVHSLPKQGVASTFKFGKSYGFLLGLLTALKLPYQTVTPVKWQSALKCRSKGDKNVTKAAAQRLWPQEKWTHALADAALIAEYGRRQERR
jgi:Holliday junction resolvasome RuvABC endonuclease subunit